LRRKPWRGWKVSKDTGTDTGVYDIRIRGWVAGVFGREGEAVGCRSEFLPSQEL